MSKPSNSIAPRSAMALFEETQRLADAVGVIGPKVCKVAIYDPNSLIPIAETQDADNAARADAQQKRWFTK